MRQKGFTLIEFIVVIVILSVVAYIGGVLLLQGFRAASSGQNILNADGQGLMALERMSRDLRLMRSAADISVATTSSITFVDVYANNISYTVSSNQLMRNSNPLANASLALKYYDANGNDISSNIVTANIRYIKATIIVPSTTANITLSTTVNPRNLP